ncbi:hypothetical protein SAMN04488072_10486 [Lentibacillus halodurans]|uniref:Uridine kinase n=1 Tax=Lentibacillus halodurans TaxID=237679 RepID=A0A1I0X424_9BACI|nr:hypothetical protein SAMN04488072_10486 [Lentibacillus halodurans]
MKDPLIVSIAAVSGVGKTSVTNCLLNRLDGARALYFDDYEFKGVLR